MSITYLDLGAAGVTLTLASTFSVLLGADSALTFVLFSLVTFSVLFLASTVAAGGGLTFVADFGFVAGVFLALAVVLATGVGLALVVAFGAVFAVLQ